ncbi:peptidase alpha-lytic pro domain protein [Cordyceps militaris CM01]|uniref:Peptidase alpha-lytic pro domain protein n=2 Tax=Cordyceps militaris TaxID=73501 RepID=G3JB56_CORMM|nr:peptidase alpha-lytic pro domain protein [Cordyceps militaris CM01]ATY60723.1 peptidase alpha-lytic pro domain [Cordyceps militaris]EGX94416.1 peptidase alpha-lytic pro domain protein [Cordyceps militaris CM01]
MELTKFLAFLAVVLPAAYGVPTPSGELHPKILEAMKRDLGLDAEQATARVARDLQAAEVIEQVRTSAGESFAGAWIDGEAGLQIGITDEALAGQVTAAGATPVVMANSLSKLEEAKANLDKFFTDETKKRSASAEGIASFFVDEASNKLVLEVLADSRAHAEELAAQVGLTAAEFEIRTVDEMPTIMATVQGGDAYYINNQFRCSVGFSVTTGFVTAGHCGTVGSSATSSGGQPLGTFAGSNFPGADMAFVRTVSGTVLRGAINGYGQGNLPVSGSTEAAVGASVCRSGSTTQVHCGTIRAKGATVNYAEGSVTGVTQTNVCAQQGDSGGSFYSGAQAQGVTSGGNGDCTRGGTTYFQPVNRILQTYGLTLVRG